MEADFSRSIGAENAPCCMASTAVPSPALSVPDGTGKPGPRGAGRAPNENTSMYVNQIRGILALAHSLKGDRHAMLLRYKHKLAASGGDIAGFDEALAILAEEENTSNLKSLMRKS